MGAFGVDPFEVRGTLRQLLEDSDPPGIVFTKLINIGSGVKKPHQQLVGVPDPELWARLQRDFQRLPAEVVMTFELTDAMSNILVDIRLAKEPAPTAR